MSGLDETAICRLLGCARPIVLAGMGGPARSELVAAVTAAGGFGFLGMVREPPALIEAEIGRLRAQGVERFGVNIIPAATGKALLAEQVATLIAQRVPAVTLFWDIDADLVGRLRAAGIAVLYQVGSAAEAREAERAGAQAIIAQGREAGGHVRGTTPLQALIPAVGAAVSVPVLAAGGLATGQDLVAALALGAQGVVLGTALLAAQESFAHDYHKLRLVSAAPGDTLLTEIFHINWPFGAKVRVLESAVTRGARDGEAGGERIPIGSEDGRPIYLFSTDSPLRSMVGDLEAMALYAGTGVGRITGIRSAAAIIDDIMAEAERALAPAWAEAANGPARMHSPACSAGEMDGAYMGLLSPVDAQAEAGALVARIMATLARHDAPQDENVPPFTAEILGLAPWALALRLLAGDQPVDLPENLPPQTLPGQIGLLIPRLPESPLRRLLVALRKEVETVVRR